MAKRSQDPFEDFVLSPLFSFILVFLMMVAGMGAIVILAKLTTP